MVSKVEADIEFEIDAAIVAHKITNTSRRIATVQSSIGAEELPFK
jgi:hypothetical protein